MDRLYDAVDAEDDMSDAEKRESYFAERCEQEYEPDYDGGGGYETPGGR